MISYKEQADEYFESVKKIDKTIDKYRQQMKTKAYNPEFCNNMIYHYKLIRADLLNTGNKLLNKSKEV